MKKMFLILVVISSLFITATAQTEVKIQRPEFSQSPNARYRLFPTSNYWTFIKLDTSNGRLWVVQYSMETSNRFEYPLSSFTYCLTSEAKNGRFTLYSTTNIHTFIMLDQENGKLWQVQWGTKINDNIVVPITSI